MVFTASIPNTYFIMWWIFKQLHQAKIKWKNHKKKRRPPSLMLDERRCEVGY